MFRYDAVKEYVEFIFARLNVEFQAGRGCCNVDHDALVIWHQEPDVYRFFLREDLPVPQKNEAVGIELARIVLGHHVLKPRTDKDRRDEALVRYVFASRLLVPRSVVARALEERWSAKQLADEALVPEDMAAFRLADYKAGQFIIPVPMARALHIARVRAFFEAQLARPS